MFAYDEIDMSCFEAKADLKMISTLWLISAIRNLQLFLSVDPEGLSNYPKKITKPRVPEMVEKYTDSTVGRHSTPVQGDDVSQSDPSSAGKVTCEISDNVKPDLAISD